ncbi:MULTISPECIES: DUF1127 domain-containing protein [unclassified Meridianimarinicoccus]|uniref:DUF1127 domain-containing protein n=1 Tax=unclassified Meridianimarinicoccus TaxID=2923344 RepID=UPI0018693745|nr:hypothetical protein [Fluviibacterium sp. MJW13]
MSIYITRQDIAPASGKHGGEEYSNPFRRLFGRAIRSLRRRKMIAMLESLDNNTLRDIGLNRRDIVRVVNEFDDRELGMAPLAQPAAPVRASLEPQQMAA